MNVKKKMSSLLCKIAAMSEPKDNPTGAFFAEMIYDRSAPKKTVLNDAHWHRAK